MTYPETVEEAREWIDTLRDSLKREREYVAKLEHDVSLQRDAIDTVLWQGGLARTTIRRILRNASAGCHFSLHRPYELNVLPEWRREQVINEGLRQTDLIR